MSRLKDKVYDWLVRKNGRVWYEYERYVREHMDEHRLHRLRHIRVLLKLNWFYRVKKGNTPYLYWDVPLEPVKPIKTEEEKVIERKKNEKINEPQKEVNKNNEIELSEYMRCKRPTAYSFAMGLKDYDVISFDIFDTLILRKLAEPQHIFMVVGERLGIYDFISYRKRAEKEVRDQKLLMQGHRECTLDEIYEKLSFWTGIDAKVGIQTEIETELEYCVENPYMKQVFQIVKGMGKEIYATSNMYLGKDILERILISCGYEGFADILVSCDYSRSKATGSLFEILKYKVSGKTIVHIGDNRVADIKGANIASIDSRLYPACRERGDSNRARGFSSLVGSAYYALVNNKLHSGVVPKLNYSNLWEYGYVYGGIIALGYVNWIHKKALVEGKDVIVFLARDGAVLKEIYDSLYDDIPSCYMLWSRIAGIRDTSVGTREQILFRIIDENINSGMTLRAALEMIGWNSCLDLFSKKDYYLDVPICKENAIEIKEIIVSNWDQIVSRTKIVVENEEAYITSCVEKYKNIALVDIGWTGKNDLKLKQIIGKCHPNKEVSIYMMGSINKVQNPYKIKDGSIECYMFAADHNREIHDDFCKMSTLALDVAEKMFSSAACSFVGVTKGNQFAFASPEIENYGAYREIANGIYDFCKDYAKDYGNESAFMNISGYDAWVSLRKGLNIELIKRMFCGTVYNKGISVSHNRENINNLIKG